MRDSSGGRGRGDDWVPPAWSHPVESAPTGPARPTGRFYQPGLAHRIDIGGSGAILGLAIAPAIAGIACLLFGVVPLFSTAAGTLPRGMLMLLLLQLGGLLISRASDSPALVLSWTACLFVSALLAPIFALQVTLLREPYVSLARHSSGPALFATLIAAIALLVVAVWAVSVGWSEPDQAALLFMPAALLWPAIIGVGGVVSQRSALLATGEVFLIGAIATAISVTLPPFTRVFVPAGTLGCEFVFLWITGQGPWFQPTSGGIVRAVYVLSLLLSVLLTVATPLLAMAAGTFFARRGDVGLMRFVASDRDRARIR
jgi:hypothetical protein